jgi:hypothetical protein
MAEAAKAIPTSRAIMTGISSARPRTATAVRRLLPVLALGLALAGAPAGRAAGPAPPEFQPLRVAILDGAQKRIGSANVYLNYVELLDGAGTKKGAIGVVLVEGRASLFLVQSNEERKLIGWAEDHRLYDAQDKLVGYYKWTAIWSYVYDDKMKKVGQAQCVAYQGVCAAGIAGYLLRLF